MIKKIIKILLPICLFLGISQLSLASNMEQVKRDAEIFARQSLIEAKDVANNAKPEDVSGYQDNVDQSNYYNNPSMMEIDAISQKKTDDKTQIIEISFEKKLQFKDEAIKVTKASKYIEENPLGTIKSIEEEYNKCEIVRGEQNQNYDIKRCDSYQNLRGSCSSGNLIKLNSNTNYSCSKTKDYYNKTITQNRHVSCIKTAYTWPTTIHNSIPNFRYNNYKIYYNTPKRMGQNCGGYLYSLSFHLDDVNHVEEFVHEYSGADDRTQVIINGTMTHNYPNRGCEWARYNRSSPNKNLKPYLKKGTNTLEIRIIVGGRGEGDGRFRFKYKKCIEFSDEWVQEESRDIAIFNNEKEEVCEQASPEECLLDGEFTTQDGYKKLGCRKKQTKYRCTQNEFTDYCASLKKVEACSKFSSNCKRRDNSGNCEEIEDRYSCGNLEYYSPKTNNLLINYPYSVSFGDIYNPLPCASSDNMQHCDIISNVTGNQSCYLGSSKSDCNTYDEDSSCTLQNDKCFNDQCTHKEKTYHCLTDEEIPAESLICSQQQYCLEESCADSLDYEVGTSLPRVLTYLKALEEIGESNNKDPANINIFTGKSGQCEKDVFGANNCCKDSGWGSSVGIGGCSYEEENLGLQKQKKFCIYVGSYCSEKEKLTKTCLKKAQSYCCFNSKLSRIIQEQGRPLLGIDFGSPQNPQCRGFTAEELQSLDFTKIDFTEYTSEITLDMKEISREDLEGNIITEIGGVVSE